MKENINFGEIETPAMMNSSLNHHLGWLLQRYRNKNEKFYSQNFKDIELKTAFPYNEKHSLFILKFEGIKYHITRANGQVDGELWWVVVLTGRAPKGLAAAGLV